MEGLAGFRFDILTAETDILEQSIVECEKVAALRTPRLPCQERFDHPRGDAGDCPTPKFLHGGDSSRPTGVSWWHLLVCIGTNSHCSSICRFAR